jgi:hypothetical protein
VFSSFLRKLRILKQKWMPNIYLRNTSKRGFKNILNVLSLKSFEKVLQRREIFFKKVQLRYQKTHSFILSSKPFEKIQKVHPKNYIKNKFFKHQKGGVINLLKSLCILIYVYNCSRQSCPEPAGQTISSTRM